MPAERAGYTVTMFLVDISASMGKRRTIDMITPSGESRPVEMTDLQRSLQLVKLKIQEMIFNGRKTDLCGVIVFGSEHTNNIVNRINGGYENVAEYIPIGQPSSATLAKLDALKPSSVHGDPIDALIVGVQTQDKHLEKKKTWTRKVVIVTNGESPIEVEDWEITAQKMDSFNIQLDIVGVDFDDPKISYHEENKSAMKRENEEFFATLISRMRFGTLYNLANALDNETSPNIKRVKSTPTPTVLRIGDISARSDEAAEISVKTTKCTALSRPKAFKKFALQARLVDDDAMDVDPARSAYAQLVSRTEFYVDKRSEETVKQEEDDDEDLLGGGDDDGVEGQIKTKEAQLEKVEKEDLVRGFKYGATYVPCPDGQFPGLPTDKGIDICGFFSAAKFRRELPLGETQYIWGDTASQQHQAAISSIVKGMLKKNAMAIARWVSREGADPKMGVLMPKSFEDVDCLVWTHMPFADDIRKYAFPSLTNLVSKKGESVKEHPYLPTGAQQKAMDDFVDAMDLTDAGKQLDDGTYDSWFDPKDSLNPAIHRIKQAIFHSAVVPDVSTHPLSPPHPELTKYFEPPERALTRAQPALATCKQIFKVKQVAKRVGKARKDDHQHVQDADDDMFLLDNVPVKTSESQSHVDISSFPNKGKAPVRVAAAPARDDDDGSETEPETDDETVLPVKTKPAAFVRPSTPVAGNGPGRPNLGLPTPARSPPHVDELDARREPGRIVGQARPLEDFQKNLVHGDLVTTAVKDLSHVLIELARKPFIMKRKDEILQCMTSMRKTCLEEDEIENWNLFIREMKDTCAAVNGSTPLWKAIQNVGRELSLISVQEAKKHGGESDVSENEASEFLHNV